MTLPLIPFCISSVVFFFATMDMKRSPWWCTNRKGTKVLVSSMLNTLPRLTAGQWTVLWIALNYKGAEWHVTTWAWAWAWEDILSDFSGMKNVVCYSFCGFVCFWIVWFVVGCEFPGIETSFCVGKLLPWQRSRAACAGKYISSANLFLNTLFQCSQLLVFNSFDS